MTGLFDRHAFRRSQPASGGQGRARRGLIAAMAAATLLAALPVGASDQEPVQDIAVHEDDGVYHVEARFKVPQPGSQVIAVLTAYEQIPRFMPDVRRSTVLERGNGRTIVEQEAVARMMMFSKRLHLVLEIREEPGALRFQDRAGRSFTRYEGSWTVSDQDGGAAIVYELTAQPAFDVPEFLLRRLLRRDARSMIERLRSEIAARSRHPKPPG